MTSFFEFRDILLCFPHNSVRTIRLKGAVIRTANVDRLHRDENDVNTVTMTNGDRYIVSFPDYSELADVLCDDSEDESDCEESESGESSCDDESDCDCEEESEAGDSDEPVNRGPIRNPAVGSKRRKVQ